MKNKLEKCRVISEIIYHIITIITIIYSAFILNNFISKDKQIDIAQTMRLDKRELFREVSNLVTKRLYDQQRLVWKIEETFTSSNVSDKQINELNKMFNNYMETVREYNINVRIISQQIKYVFNEHISKLFSEEKDLDNSSISCSFMSIHREIFELRKNSWRTNNYKKLIYELESSNGKLLDKIINCLQEMANLTFAKDKILEKHAI